MLLRSLLLCSSNATVQMLSRGFKALNVEAMPCSTAEDALRNFSDQRFDALVIEHGDHLNTTQVLKQLKAAPSFKNSLTILLLDSGTQLGAAFRMGAELTIYKPISPDRVRKSLRAVQNLMSRGHQRKFDRLALRLPARVRVDEKTYVPASILDVSQGGVALSTQRAVPGLKKLELEFAIPGKGGVIATSADVIWSDGRGRLGAQFSNMQPLNRRVLSDWVVAQLKSIELHKAAIVKARA